MLIAIISVCVFLVLIGLRFAGLGAMWAANSKCGIDVDLTVRQMKKIILAGDFDKARRMLQTCGEATLCKTTAAMINARGDRRAVETAADNGIQEVNRALAKKSLLPVNLAFNILSYGSFVLFAHLAGWSLWVVIPGVLAALVCIVLHAGTVFLARHCMWSLRNTAGGIVELRDFIIENGGRRAGCCEDLGGCVVESFGF